MLTIIKPFQKSFAFSYTESLFWIRFCLFRVRVFKSQVRVLLIKHESGFSSSPSPGPSFEVCQTARVFPIPKINNPTCEKDYRPISILPALSKIFERLVNNQIVTYIDEQGLLASGISGYRRGHSTTTVLLRIRDDVIKAMKRGEVTMMVFADYSKAFDTI